MKREKHVLSKNTFSETMKWLEQELCKVKISQKEILTAQLLLEETFLRLSEGAGNPADFSVTVALRRRFGDISLLLEANGEPYNPMVEMTEVNEEEEDAYGLAVLKAHRNKLGYSRKNGKNLVSIKVHETSSKDARNTFIGIVLGIVCGILLNVRRCFYHDAGQQRKAVGQRRIYGEVSSLLVNYSLS